MSARSLRRFSAIVVIASAAAGAVHPASAASVPTGFVEELVASGLAAPTSFAFLPDGRLVVTEQNTGAIRLVVGSTLVSGALVVVPELSTAGSERGLLSIAVDPGWPVRPYVYVHFSRTGGTLRLMRFTAAGNLADPASTTLRQTLWHELFQFPRQLPNILPGSFINCVRQIFSYHWPVVGITTTSNL